MPTACTACSSSAAGVAAYVASVVKMGDEIAGMALQMATQKDTPSAMKLAAMRTAIAGLSAWLAEDVAP